MDFRNYSRIKISVAALRMGRRLDGTAWPLKWMKTKATALMATFTPGTRKYITAVRPQLEKSYVIGQH